MRGDRITDRGYPNRKSTNPNKPAVHKQEPDRLKMIADQDPAGNKITTNYPMRESDSPRDRGGREIKAQKLRGYVLNERDIGIDNVQNGNARRGSPPTVREIGG